MGADPGRWSDQGPLVAARLDGQSVTAVEGRDMPQSLVLGVARQTASEALSHSEAFTADLMFIKDILGILGFYYGTVKGTVHQLIEILYFIHLLISFIHSFNLKASLNFCRPCLSIAAQWLHALRGNCWALCFLGSVFVHGTTCFTL